MADQSSANHATTFKLALLAMLLSIWMIGKATETEPFEEESPREVVLHPPAVEFEPVGERKIVEKEIDPTTPGSVEGFVKFAGEKKPRAVINIGNDSYCLKFYPDSQVLDERWVWGENDTLENVLVHVTAGLPERAWPIPASPVVMELKECRFNPHVVVAMSRQLVEFRHVDQTLHHAHVWANSTPQYGEAQPRPDWGWAWMARAPEIGVFVKCAVHPWMNGYIHAMSHPFYDLTGKQGSFKIGDLPPGEYELSLWHEVKAFRDSVVPIKVKIEPGKTTRVDFTIKPAQK